MAHDKIYGFDDSKCRREVLSKAQMESEFSQLKEKFQTDYAQISTQIQTDYNNIREDYTNFKSQMQSGYAKICLKQDITFTFYDNGVFFYSNLDGLDLDRIVPLGYILNMSGDKINGNMTEGIFLTPIISRTSADFGTYGRGLYLSCYCPWDCYPVTINYRLLILGF